MAIETSLPFSIIPFTGSILNTLGSTLGKSDIDGQMNEINEFKERLNNQIKQAEEEKKKNSKMYKTLGTIGGLVIVILLF